MTSMKFDLPDGKGRSDFLNKKSLDELSTLTWPPPSARAIAVKFRIY